MMVWYLWILLMLLWHEGIYAFSWFKQDRAAYAAQQESWDTAKSLLNELVRDNPDDPSLLYDAGVSSYKLGEIQQARSYFQQVADSKNAQPDLKEQSFFNLGNTYMKDEQFKEAIEAYDGALKINPKNERALHNKKIAEEKLRQKEQDQNKKDQKQDKQQNNKDDQKNDQKDSGHPEPDEGSGDDQQSQDQNQQSQGNDKKDKGSQGSGDNKDQQDQDQSQKGDNKNESSQKDQGKEQESAGDKSKEQEQQKGSKKPEPQKEEKPSDGGKQEKKEQEEKKSGSSKADEKKKEKKQEAAQENKGNGKGQKAQAAAAEKEGEDPTFKNINPQLARMLQAQEASDAQLQKQLIRAQVSNEMGARDGENCW